MNTKTRRNPVNSSEELLDLIVTTNTLHKKHVHTAIYEEPNLSDHYILITKYRVDITRNHQTKFFRNYKKANWEGFQNSLNKHATNLQVEINTLEINENNVNTFADKISNSYVEAFNENCPLSRYSSGNWKINSKIMTLIKAKRKLRRDFSRNKNLNTKLQINRLNHEIKREIKIQKMKDWEFYCENVNHETNPRNFWKKVKKTTTPTLNNTNTELIDNHGNKITDHQEQANLLADTLRSNHQIHNTPQCDSAFKETVQNYIKSNIENFSPNFANNDNGNIDPISIDEIKLALSKSKNFSSPGFDGVTYRMLKCSTDKMYHVLCTFFNLILLVGYFPIPWKKAKVTLIPKPKKNPLYPNNYRPISLLSCIGKTLERIIANRIRNILETKNFFSDYQCGFRNHRGTFNHLFRLTHDIKISQLQKRVTSAIFLDAEKAFDNTWHDGLKYKFHYCNTSVLYDRLISSFLSDRQLIVHFKGKYSNSIKLNAGTPQGSVLSPLLYILYVNDIPSVSHLNCSISQFADDIALWSSSSNSQNSTNYLKKALNEIETWCNKWRIKINPQKSQLVNFRSSQQPKLNTSLPLFGNLVKSTNQATFLGVIFDEKLNFHTYIDHICAKAWTRLSSLKNLLLNRNLNPKTGQKIYKVLIRPILEYGSICYISTSKTKLRKLERIHVTANRLAFKIPSYISEKQVLLTAKMQPLYDRLTELNTRITRRLIKKDQLVTKTIIRLLVTHPKNQIITPLDLINYRNWEEVESLVEGGGWGIQDR